MQVGQMKIEEDKSEMNPGVLVINEEASEEKHIVLQMRMIEGN